MPYVSIAIFLAMQVAANLVFKWGGSAPELYWKGFIGGNVIGATSILFMILMYRSMPAALVIAIGTGGTFLLNQLAMYLVYREKISPAACVGLVLIFCGILMTALMNHPSSEARAEEIPAAAGKKTAEEPK